MKVVVGVDPPIEIGTTATAPTIGIVDYSRRVTDDFGVTTVVERGFSRRMSVQIALPFDEVDGVQRLLAELRATSAQWIADDSFAWLQPTGFYKNFEVDLAVPPLSYCTLTVEGLAENELAPDAGEDPAPEGSASTLLMLRPLAITDGVLASSSVAEDDFPVWQAGVTYAAAYRVILPATHRIYESLGADNLGNDPAASPAHWLDVGPTNRWAMFDEALGTTTAAGGSIVVEFDAAASGVALLDFTGSAQVEVIAEGEALPQYDQTVVGDGGAITFLDLPAIAGTVRVTITGTAPVSVGTLLLGEVLGLGITEASPTAGISDFSRKEVDDFGEVTIVQRGWAKRMTARALINSAALDITADRIASVRARPVLWIGDAGTDSLTVYGFFRDFSIEVGETLGKVSLSIEGLSKAAALTSPWAAEIDALRTDIDRIASDGFLNAGEKPRAVIDYNALIANFEALDARYLALGSPVDITPSRDDASDMVAALNGYLAALAPSWTDATQDTPIVPETYELRWVEAYEAVAAFLAAITGRVGAAAQSIRVEATHRAFGYDTTGTIVAQTTTVSATRQNTVETTQWRALTSEGAVIASFQTAAALVTSLNIASDGGFSSADNDTITMTEVGFNGLIVYAGTTGIIFEVRLATTTTIKDTINVAKVQDGAAGTDGLDGTDGLPGADGADGQTQRIHFAYADSADGTVNFTTGAIGARRYTGTLVDFVIADSTNPADYTWSYSVAQDGAAGTPGAPGDDGESTYVHLAYSNAIDGSVDFHVSDWTGRTYIGSYVDQTLADSTNPADYTWSLSKGADGEPAKTMEPATYSVDFAANHDGTIKLGQQPRYIQCTYLSGETDVSALATWSASGNGNTSTVDADGTLAIGTVTGSGYTDVTGTYGGLPITKRITTKVNKDQAPPATSTSTSTGSIGFADFTNTYPAGIESTGLVMTADPSGQIQAILSSSYYAYPNGGDLLSYSYRLAGTVRYRLAGSGSAWSDFPGGEIVGSTSGAAEPIEPASEGVLSINQTKTGLTAGALYEVGLVLRRFSSVRADGADLSGTLTAKQP